MLFKDFFPRLQVQALARYDVDLSRRQFTSWRELGLIPGPAHPQGRGRGLSPDRHWPLRAYRRTLRICRYKKRGIHHIPAWWILLWLSGEGVPFDVLRSALQRELKRTRRQSRYLADSGFLASSGPTDFETIPSAAEPNPITSLLGQIIQSPRSGISPEMQRDVLKLPFNEESTAEIGRVFMTMVTALMGRNEAPEKLGVSLTDVWRPGHLSETAHDYIADCPANDLVLARQILWERLRLVRKVAPTAHLLGASRPASILFVVAMTLAKQGLANRRSIDDVLSQIYQIADDRLNERDPANRLAFLHESLRLMDGNDTAFGDDRSQR